MSDDIQATLAISEEEACQGTTRALNLPDKRRVTIAVPAGAYEGQVLLFPGQGAPANAHEAAGALVVVLTVQRTEMASVTAEDDTTAPAMSGFSTLVSPSGASSAQPAPLAAAIPPPPPWVTPGQAALTPPPPSLSDELPAPAPVAPPASLPGPTRKAVALIIVLLLIVLIILASIGGVFLHNQSEQQAAASSATATSLANNATGTAIVNDALAGENATATSIAQATATVITANPDPYGAGGTIKIVDPLQRSPTPGSGWAWEQSSQCAYKSGSYHVIKTNQYVSECELYSPPTYNNFALEFKMKILHDGLGGCIFRWSKAVNPSNNYILSFSAQGNYQVWKYSDSTTPTTIRHGFSSAFYTGYNQTNTIGIVVRGSEITWYVNGQRVDSVADNGFSIPTSEALVGLVAANYANSSSVASEASFNDFRIWLL